MRRIIVTCTALVAMLGLSSVASAAVNTTLGIKLSSAKAKAGTKLTTSYTYTSDLGFETAPYQTRFVLYFPKGTTFPYKQFPSCTISKSSFSKTGILPKACKKARVGPGTAISDARLENLHNVPTTSFDAYNGGGKGVLYLPAIVQQPAQINVWIKGTLKKASGAYGAKLDTPVTLPNVLGQIPFVKSFKIGPIGKTVTRGGKTYSFITNPRTCPKGGWKFKLVTSFNTGETSTAKDTVACKR